MGIKTNPDGKKPRSYGTQANPRTHDVGSIGSTFRQDGPVGERKRKQPTTKTTLDLETELFKALKLHAVTEGTSMRDLVDQYIRAGLASDGVTINP